MWLGSKAFVFLYPVIAVVMFTVAVPTSYSVASDLYDSSGSAASLAWGWTSGVAKQQGVSIFTFWKQTVGRSGLTVENLSELLSSELPTTPRDPRKPPRDPRKLKNETKNRARTNNATDDTGTNGKPDPALTETDGKPEGEDPAPK